jgi:hypothetical protein
MRRSVLNCDRVSQPRTIHLLPVLRRELPWFALMAAALLATFAISHVFIRRGVLLPSLAAGGAPGWVWAALYAPELVALLMIGWRLRSWGLVLAYAGGAATLREGFHFALRWIGEADGHVRFASALAEVAIALPITVAAYAVVFLAASATGRDESGQAELAARPARSVPR